jgi:hypothetical protein
LEIALARIFAEDNSIDLLPILIAICSKSSLLTFGPPNLSVSFDGGDSIRRVGVSGEPPGKSALRLARVEPLQGDKQIRHLAGVVPGFGGIFDSQGIRLAFVISTET